MKIRLRYIFLFIIPLFICCESTKEKNGLPFKLQVDVDNSNKLLYSKLFDSIEYIGLSTTDDPYSYLMGIDKLLITDKFFYCFQSGRDTKVTVFDRKGAFVFGLAPPAEGPGKIISGRDFLVSQEKNIEILDQFGKKINTYDESGEYLRSIPLEGEYFFNMRKFPTGTYVLNTPTIIPNQTSYRIHFVNNKGRAVKQALPVYHKGIEIPIQEDWFTSTLKPNEFLFHSLFNDTIYSIKETKAKALYHIDFGSYFFTKDETAALKHMTLPEIANRFINNPDRIAKIDKVISTSQAVFIYYDFGGRRRLSVFKSNPFSAKHFSSELINDIDFGPTRSYPITKHKDYLIFLTNGRYLNDHIESLEYNNDEYNQDFNVKDKTNKLKLKVKNISLNSENPVLIFARLRPEYR